MPNRTMVDVTNATLQTVEGIAKRLAVSNEKDLVLAFAALSPEEQDLANRLSGLVREVPE